MDTIENAFAESLAKLPKHIPFIPRMISGSGCCMNLLIVPVYSTDFALLRNTPSSRNHAPNMTLLCSPGETPYFWPQK